uniref:Transposase n=1 Tax=Ascaris lumbricoides TaxID=6252 RepID=A0A0M3HMI7_ASCLU
MLAEAERHAQPVDLKCDHGSFYRPKYFVAANCRVFSSELSALRARTHARTNAAARYCIDARAVHYLKLHEWRTLLRLQR